MLILLRFPRTPLGALQEAGGTQFAPSPSFEAEKGCGEARSGGARTGCRHPRPALVLGQMAGLDAHLHRRVA